MAALRKGNASLFDIAEDPSEKFDMSSNHSAIFNELRRLLAEQSLDELSLPEDLVEMPQQFTMAA